MDFARVGKLCSFCGTPGGPEVKLAGGLGAMICDECVSHFHEVNQHPEKVKQGSRPPWDEMSVAELLSTLSLITRSAEQNTIFAQQWVDMLRERRASWAEIGNALGVTRQSAWEKYARRSAEKSATA